MYRFAASLLTFIALLILFTRAHAQFFDENDYARVHIKCPAIVNADSIIEKDSIGETFRLYMQIDDNIRRSKQSSRKYVFGGADNEAQFFIAYAKADFLPGTFRGFPSGFKLRFLDVFFVKKIDMRDGEVTIKSQSKKLHYTISIADFQKAFIWYDSLLDKSRIYIPIYGFLSLPSDANELPVFYRGFQKNKEDRQVFARFSVALRHFDFYRILDYKDDMYLLAQDKTIFGHTGERNDYGILGWIEKKYILLWRSRLYYHPKRDNDVMFYESSGKPYTGTDEINRFYARQDLQIPNALSPDSSVLKAVQDLKSYYRNFGFPEIYPPYVDNKEQSRVFVLGAFPYSLQLAFVDAIKSNLNVFFLIDNTYSMMPFREFITSFKKGIYSLSRLHFGQNETRIFSYHDSDQSDESVFANIEFASYFFEEDLEFGQEKRDSNYSEPLMRALKSTLEHIAEKVERGSIGTAQYILLFILTDAGPNDWSAGVVNDINKIVDAIDPFIFFVIPDGPGVRPLPRSKMEDTPASAYRALVEKAEALNTGDPRHYRSMFVFQGVQSLDMKERVATFDSMSRAILEKIDNELKGLIKGSTERQKVAAGTSFLNFIPRGVMKLFDNAGVSDIQVIGHKDLFIKSPQNQELWEQRVAIPYDVMSTYVNAVGGSVTLNDLKKLCIVNSLVSVYEIKECRQKYEKIRKLLHLRTSDSIERSFYKSVTGRSSRKSAKWNDSLERAELKRYLKERVFYLNLVEKDTKSRYIFLNLEELFRQGMG